MVWVVPNVGHVRVGEFHIRIPILVVTETGPRLLCHVSTGFWSFRGDRSFQDGTVSCQNTNA